MTILPIALHEIITVKIKIKHEPCDDKGAFLSRKIVFQYLKEMIFADKSLITYFCMCKGADPKEQLSFKGLEEGRIVSGRRTRTGLKSRFKDLLEFAHKANGALELRFRRIFDQR